MYYSIALSMGTIANRVNDIFNTPLVFYKVYGIAFLNNVNTYLYVISDLHEQPYFCSVVVKYMLLCKIYIMCLMCSMRSRGKYGTYCNYEFTLCWWGVLEHKHITEASTQLSSYLCTLIYLAFFIYFFQGCYLSVMRCLSKCRIVYFWRVQAWSTQAIL